MLVQIGKHLVESDLIATVKKIRKTKSKFPNDEPKTFEYVVTLRADAVFDEKARQFWLTKEEAQPLFDIAYKGEIKCS